MNGIISKKNILSAGVKITKKKIFIFITIIGIIYFALSYFSSNISGMDKYLNTKLDSDIEVTVIKKDGNKKSYNTNYFEKLDIGDKLILNIRMPEKKPFINSSLCMKLYNCTVDIKYNDRLLYSYGHDQVKNNKQIGNVFVNIGLPDDAWGNDITVECYNYENDSLDKVRNVLIFPTEMSLRYPIAGNELEFIFCMASVGLAIFVLVMVLLFGTFNKIDIKQDYSMVFFDVNNLKVANDEYGHETIKNSNRG